jgi:TPR repeat protein
MTEAVTSAGVGRGAKPLSLKPRLLVLCGHEPTLDPRIEWAAKTAAKKGWDVRVHGFTIGAVQPKFADPEDYITSRGRAEETPFMDKGFLKIILRQGILPFWVPILLGLFWGLSKLIYLLGRLILAPWIIFDWALEKIKLSWLITAPIEFGLYLLYHKLKAPIDQWTDNWPRRMAEGLSGYGWYFKELILRQAHSAYAHFDDASWVPDVIHANDPDSLLAAVLLKKRYLSRLVYDAHEYGPEAYLMEPSPKWLFYSYESYMMAHVDAAVTVTPQIAEKFQNRYRGRPYFEVVPNAMPAPDEIRPLNDPFMRATAKGRVRVLFQGGFAAHRGVEELIDAWEHVDHTRAVLYIRGPENSYREKLIQKAQKSDQFGNSLFFLPSVAESDLTSSALNCDIGVISYLSVLENHLGACPNKLSQYMQSGSMVVAVDLPFVRTVLEASQAGICFDDKVDGAFAEALNHAIADEELREICAANGRSYARSVFHYENYFAILQALYKGADVPKDIAHTRLNGSQTLGGDIILTNKATLRLSKLDDRLQFENGFKAQDKKLKIDPRRGAFGADDVALLTENLKPRPKKKSVLLSPKRLVIDSLDGGDSDFHSGQAALNGLFGPPDINLAREHYEKAAAAGHVEAMHMLGVMHQEAMGTQRNYQEALFWYVRAGLDGHLPAMLNAAILYQVGGPGLKPDLNKAFDFYQRAAKAGDAQSAINAATLLIDGMLGDNRELDAIPFLKIGMDLYHSRSSELMDVILHRLGFSAYLNSKSSSSIYFDESPKSNKRTKSLL